MTDRAEFIDRRARRSLLPMLGDLAASRAEVEAETGDAEPCPVAGGQVWLASGAGGVLRVLEVATDPSSVAQARDQVLALARERGATQVTAERYPDDPVSSAFVDHPAFEVTASRLVLDVTEAPDSADVELVPMTDAVFDDFLGYAVGHFADAQREAGLAGTADDHLALAREVFARLLPDGARSPGHHLWAAVSDGDGVGWLWVCERSPRAGFVYDVVVEERHRGRGLGRATMTAAALWCRDHGLALLGLNVHAQNVAARRLYDSLGYRVVLDHLAADPSSPVQTG